MASAGSPDLELVPLATVLGLKAVPALVLWANAFNPHLSVRDDTLAIRCLRTAHLAIPALGPVTYRHTVGRMIGFAPAGSRWRWSVLLVGDGDAGALLAMLARRGAPLSPEARAFLAGLP